MTILTKSSAARMIFIISWNSDGVSHEEHYHVSDVNMWRDIFPDSLREKLLGSPSGEEVTCTFLADQLTEKCNQNCQRTLPLSKWQPPSIDQSTTRPMAGRYYPSGFLRGVSGVYPQSLAPVRVLYVNDYTFTVDFSHPLSGKKLTVKITIEDIFTPRKERGGRCSNRLADVLENGPGMEGRNADNLLHFDKHSAYQRLDQNDDHQFYRQPRLVSHIDSQASTNLKSAVNRFLEPGSRILDLMASVDSHLPSDNGFEVLGLGMNAIEMEANSSLSGHIIHNLNEDPNIPYSDRMFDAVLCNLSIEYLRQPQLVLKEAARILKPAGRVFISFSNRWFPPKVTRLWTELHEFERVGLVIQYCWPFFDEITTMSYRNWPRPETDRHYPSMLTSDPLYVVTGKART